MLVDLKKRKLKKAGIATASALALVLAGAAGLNIILQDVETSPNAKISETSKAATTETPGQSTSWGLSFQRAGETPVGNATAEELAKYDAYYCDSPGKKTLYLTFDAGYENGYTPQILNVLKKEKVSAAFFVVGTYIKENPELIVRMEKEGHLVGNHTMDHPDMSQMSDDAAFQRQLAEVEDAYQDATGKKMPKLYRPPQGNFSFDNLKAAKALGYKTAFWSLAYVDWYADRQPTREEALQKLIPRTHDGAVILLHSTSKTNAEILQELIQRWKDAGYRFAPLSALGEGDK